MANVLDLATEWLNGRKVTYRLVESADEDVGCLAISAQARPTIATMVASLRGRCVVETRQVNNETLVAVANRGSSPEMLSRYLNDLTPDEFTQRLSSALTEDQFADATKALENDFNQVDKINKRKRPGQRLANSGPSDAGINSNNQGQNPNPSVEEKSPFAAVLDEALDNVGIDFRPGDILKRLQTAMKQVGLADRLRAAGITARITSDQQYVTFRKRIGQEDIKLVQLAVQQLAEPKNLEMALQQLVDVASGNAPGAGEQQRQQLRDAEKVINQVASQYAANQPQQQPQQKLSPPSAPQIN